MNKFKFICSLCCLCFSLALCRVQAQETPRCEPAKFELQLIFVADTEPHEFIWQVTGLPHCAFKSLSSYSLRKWVADLSAGSTIEWFPSDALIGGERSGEEITQFQAFCKKEDVKFVIHMAG
jgi:hypothetical protein